MTTRRLPRGPAPPRGRIGLFGLFGIRSPSVETPERRIDCDAPAQDAIEAARRQRALEAGQPPARVNAPARKRAAGRQLTADGGEADELRLRSLAAAACARARRLVATPQ